MRSVAEQKKRNEEKYSERCLFLPPFLLGHFACACGDTFKKEGILRRFLPVWSLLAHSGTRSLSLSLLE